MTKYLDEALLPALYTVRRRAYDTEARRHMLGICHEALCTNRRGNAVAKRLNTIMRLWPKASGSSVYPVPSGDDRSASQAYIDAIDGPGRQHFWPDIEPGGNPYGDLRMELLEFCIGYL